jgi:hypothetical protein
VKVEVGFDKRGVVLKRGFHASNGVPDLIHVFRRGPFSGQLGQPDFDDCPRIVELARIQLAQPRFDRPGGIRVSFWIALPTEPFFSGLTGMQLVMRCFRPGAPACRRCRENIRNSDFPIF